MVQYCSTGAAIRAQRCRLGPGEQGTSLQRETIQEALSWIQAVPAANRSFLNAPNGAGRDAAVTSSDSVPVIISLESDPTSSLLDMMTRHSNYDQASPPSLANQSTPGISGAENHDVCHTSRIQIRLNSRIFLFFLMECGSVFVTIFFILRHFCGCMALAAKLDVQDVC